MKSATPLLMLIYTTITLLLRVAASKGELRHLSSNKEFISRLDDGQFEVVHPFQVRDKNERIGIDTRNYFLNASVHYKQVTIVIRTNVIGRLKLLLTLNEIIFVNETDFRKLDDQGESVFSKRVENCYYQGVVNGEESSFVAVSSCNGLRGIIAFGNGTAFGIWPLDGGDRGRRHPHVLYRTKWSTEALCTTQPIVDSRHSRKAAVKRDVTRQTKYVELALIGDHSFMKEHDLAEDVAIEYMLEAVNIADLMFSRDLNVRLSVIYAEEWMDAQRLDAHAVIERTLSGAIEYVTGHIYHIPKDASLVFTRESFANNEVTSAAFGSVCTARAVSLQRAIDTYTVHETGQIVAQGIAHVLGIDHDSSDCSCEMGNQCVMGKQIGTIGSPFLWQFSRCSIARMHSVLQSGHLQCLLNRPLQASSLRHCGNGMVDDGEECDCGPRDECFDPCCDPLTCTLRAHAQCAAHQPCCHRCQLRPAGHICRPSHSICDVPEVCTGEHGDCPSDGYLIDGTVCGINGQCWKGNCSDIEQQCRHLWGEDSSSADEHCFERNQLGAEYGNCGEDRDGKLKKCALENVRCGTLHCRGGTQSPIDHRLNSFNLQFLHEAKQIQCKMVTQSVFGMVSDGSNCGSGKVCVQGMCLPLTQVSPPVHCPSNNLALQCSGHGDCTTSERCLCFDGWTGNACDVRSNTSRRISLTTSTPNDLIIPSIAAGRTLNTTTLLAILLLVGVVLLMLLICLLFCYRRRSAIEFPEGPLDEKMNESIPENIQRSIKFGTMPSYREEKRKRKKNKRVYDALQRINEASDERDSVSLKSRESGSNGQTPNSAVGSTISYSESPYVSRQPMLSNIISGSTSSILKKENSASRRLFSGSDLYNESPCGDVVGSPSRRSAMGHVGGLRYERNRNGYSTDSELGLGHYTSRYMETFVGADLSPTLSQSSLSRIAPTPLKLNNIGMLLKQLQYNDDITSEAELSAVEADHMDHVDLSSNTESTRGFEAPDPLKFSPSAEIPSVYEARLQPSSSHDYQRSPTNHECSTSGVCTHPTNDVRSISRNNFDKTLTESQQPTPSGDTAPPNTSVNESSSAQSPSLFSDTFRLEV